MTFEEYFAGNKYLLKPAGRHRQLFTMEDLEETWNAAINQVLSDLQANVYTNQYNVTTIDYDEATRVCTRLLSKSS